MISTKQLIWLFLAVVFWVAVVWYQDYTHFTWWSLNSFAIYSILGAIGIEHWFFYLFLSTQFTVIAGVVVMSFMKCDLLNEANNANGNFVYIIGNFFMHYLPSVIAIYLKSTKQPPSTINEGNIFLGCGLFILYTSIYTPNTIYGCAISDIDILIGAWVVTFWLWIVYTFYIQKQN